MFFLNMPPVRPGSQDSLIDRIMLKMVAEDPEIAGTHDLDMKLDLAKRTAQQVLTEAGISLEALDTYLDLVRQRLLEAQVRGEYGPGVARDVSTGAIWKRDPEKGTA